MEHIIFLLTTKERAAVIVLLLCIIPIFILMITSIVIAIRRSKKVKNERKERIDLEEVDLVQKNIFILAYGGDDNILEVKKEMNRITVTVVNIDLVQNEELQNLGATGVLLVGNQVKASFGDRSPYVYKLIEKE